MPHLDVSTAKEISEAAQKSAAKSGAQEALSQEVQSMMKHKEGAGAERNSAPNGGGSKGNESVQQPSKKDAKEEEGGGGEGKYLPKCVIEGLEDIEKPGGANGQGQAPKPGEGSKGEQGHDFAKKPIHQYEPTGSGEVKKHF